MDAAVGDQLFKRNARDLAAHRIECGNDNRLRRIVDDQIDARRDFERADIASFATDDTALHIVVRQRDHRNGRLRHMIGGALLNRQRRSGCAPSCPLLPSRGFQSRAPLPPHRDTHPSECDRRGYSSLLRWSCRRCVPARPADARASRWLPPPDARLPCILPFSASSRVSRLSSFLSNCSSRWLTLRSRRVTSLLRSRTSLSRSDFSRMISSLASRSASFLRSSAFRVASSRRLRATSSVCPSFFSIAFLRYRYPAATPNASAITATIAYTKALSPFYFFLFFTKQRAVKLPAFTKSQHFRCRLHGNRTILIFSAPDVKQNCIMPPNSRGFFK